MSPIVRPLTSAPAWDRTHRKMARSKFLRLLRAMSFTRDTFNMAARFECTRCKAPVRLQHGSGIVQPAASSVKVNVKTDTFSLACQCTTWSVK
jgi:hypothetical protein